MASFLVIKETNQSRITQLQELLSMAGYEARVQECQESKDFELDQPWDYGSDGKSTLVSMYPTPRLQEKSESLSTIIKWLGKILDDQPEMMCRFLPDGTLIFVNASYAHHFKKPKSQLLNTSAFDYVPEEDRQRIKDYLATFTPSNPVKTIDHRVLNPDGKMIWHEWTDRASFDATGKVINFSSIGRNITKRKEVESENLRLLQEKDLILKEAYHRMKNNFQSVVALIRLKLSAVESPEAESVLQSLVAQTQAIQVLYEQLLHTENFNHLNVGEFLPWLVENLQQAYIPEAKVILESRVESLNIQAKRAFQLGLIVNELTTNAIKYGFQVKNQGKIRIFLTTRSEILEVVIWDNGDGIPKGWSIEETQGFGLNIVRMLCEELDAHLSFASNSEETSFRVEIPRDALV